MSIFDNLKFLHALPEDGQKIKFIKPCEHHWFTNTVKDQELLEIGKEYTVRKTQLNSSSTYVWLEELEPYDKERDLPFFCLSKVYFSWDTPKFDPSKLLNIQLNLVKNIQYYYKFGITINNKQIKEGDPMLFIEHDLSHFITKAYFNNES
jgi:hypothetical protein